MAKRATVDHELRPIASLGGLPRGPLSAALAAWFVLSAAGALVLALPDGGRRLVAFSGAHGLTALDALGTALLLVGWLLPLGWVLRRPELRTPILGLASRGRYAFAGGVGVGLIVASVFADFGGWWAAGAALLASLQLYALVRIARRPDARS